MGRFISLSSEFTTCNIIERCKVFQDLRLGSIQSDLWVNHILEKLIGKSEEKECLEKE